MRRQAACCAAHATPTACRRPWPISNGDGDRSASWTSEARLSRTGLGRLSILAGERPEAARSPERFDPGEPPDAGTGKPAPLRGGSEERRVGNACVSPGRSRWAPKHSKKKKN